MTAVVEKQALTLGFIPLTDCAPLVVALEKELFAAEGLDVTLSRENSWATIRDKVGIGLLDGAQMLAGLPLAATLGLGCSRMPMLTALGLDLNGNAITVSRTLYARMQEADPVALATPVTSAQALAKVIAADHAAGRPKLTFAMVFPVSSHHYMLRHWLVSGGIDPDRDVHLTVIPPPQMVMHLQKGTIDGYCVGEPWNALAVSEGLGCAVITSYEIWNNHPEKVFGVTTEWAERHPRTHQAVLRALIRACRWLDEPDNRFEAARLLADPQYIAVPEAVLSMSLTGAFQRVPGQSPEVMPDFNVFYRYAANFPWRSHAEISLVQMYRWGQLRQVVDIKALAAQVYRPDLYRQAAAALELAYPTVDTKTEDSHSVAWTLTEASTPLTLGADRALADLHYLPGDVWDYLASSAAGQSDTANLLMLNG